MKESYIPNPNMFPNDIWSMLGCLNVLSLLNDQTLNYTTLTNTEQSVVCVLVWLEVCVCG